MSVDPYVDQRTGVLRNRLGITDTERLREVEAGLTMAAITDLGSRVLRGAYDLDHLCSFHREIFADIYDWAGEVRTVGIARTEPFCLPQHIHAYSAEVFGNLARERHLRGLGRVDFVDRFTHYYAEVNALHPFREGNGRTQRAFFRQLTSEAGWSVGWAGMDPSANEQASRDALRGDDTALRELLDDLIAS